MVAAIFQPVYLLTAPIQIASGVTILRRRAWGGYGFALVYVANLMVIPIVTVDSSSRVPGLLATAILGGVLTVIFFLAGSALSGAGAILGRRWPWICLALASTMPFLFVRAYVMPSGSMEQTLLIGDHMLMRVFPQPTAHRGSLLVFHYPLDPKQIFIKRVTGLEGDRIQIKDRVLYVNGARLAEPYVIHTFPDNAELNDFPNRPNYASLETVPGLLNAYTEMVENHVKNGEVVVPSGKYFVLGDNRDNSLDSRYWGFVDKAAVMGEPFLIYYSDAVTATDSQRNPFTLPKIRWDRMFKPL